MSADRTIGGLEAMELNRHQRRMLGKANHIKIPGSTKPFVKAVVPLNKVINIDNRK